MRLQPKYIGCLRTLAITSKNQGRHNRRWRDVAPLREARWNTPTVPVPFQVALGMRSSGFCYRIRSLRRRSLTGLGFVAPALLTLVATFVYPLSYNLWLSLHSYNLSELYLGIHFVGLRNYFAALNDPYFWTALRNSLIITLASLALELPIGMALAMLLSGRICWNGTVRFLIVLPLLLIPAVTAYMWRFMFQYDGVVNYILRIVHLSPVNWAGTIAGLASVIIVTVWENAAFSVIVFLAGLQAIDPELWAAAKVDGAGPVERFLHVTLPLMRPFILVVLAIRTMDLLRLFDEGYILTGGAPARTTETLSQLVYTDTFTYFNIGQGSALAVMEGLMVVAAVLFCFLLLGVRQGS
jgi:multiple sugar transport system permease protein